MYRHCVFCSADLGANEALEAFPVGRSVAFDAWRGRLWAVCPRCARWNLAPIEERWEATEEADRLFTDTRVRVQSENVGLARLRDGTRLIRIGEALPGELAAWRYGDHLVARHRKYLVGVGVAAAVGVALTVSGISAGVSITSLWWLYHMVGDSWMQKRRGGRLVARVEAIRSPTGTPLVLCRRDLGLLTLVSDEVGGLAIRLPGPDGPISISRKTEVLLRGGQGRAVLSRVMVHVNRSGGRRDHVHAALDRIAACGSADNYLDQRARHPAAFAPGTHLPVLHPIDALALEMALHEESERHALEGELSALTAAWREAEEIAAIADALSFDPLERLRGRGAGEG